MIGHYTQAAMVAENRRLAVPASTDTLPTSAMQEDHVSLGWSSARKLRAAVANLSRILAVELVAGAWGLELRRPLQPAHATAAVAAVITETAGGPGPDQWLSPRLETIEHLVATGAILTATPVDLR
jgi:histidine ammonia-lyase